MNIRNFTARFALLVLCALSMAMPATANAAPKARFWQCAVFAREISSVKIHGNAWTWWEQSQGRYARGNAPKPGAVMSFKKTGKNPFGHVAMVSDVVSDREVLLTHANWSFAGGIERNVRAIDVSPAGDWSEVKVWFAPTGGLGTSVYPVNGFIYGGAAPADEKTIVPLELDLSDLVMEKGFD